MKKPAIAIHKDQLNGIGLETISLHGLDKSVQTVHRDDHYMFILQQTGSSLWEVDFKELSLLGPYIGFIAPGQVHRYLELNNCSGWLIFMDAGLISSQHRDLLETYVHACQSVSVQQENTVFQLVPVLETVISQESLALRKSIINSVSETLAGLVISRIIESQTSVNFIGGQKHHTVVRFKQLVTAKCKELKQVKAYAALLNITPLYLNEVVKEITGFSASYWINQEILLEAKRMLYYTSLNVSQIAYELGYEDHAYFSRFFKKNTGMTALEFRNAKPLFVQS